MTIRNTTNHYGTPTKWLHWIAAILVIGMIIYGTLLATMIPSGTFKNQLIGIHKSFGLLILALTIIRWVWRRCNVQPEPLSIDNTYLKKLVPIFHELLYVVVFCMLLSGIFMTAAHHYPIPFFGLFKIPTFWFINSKPVAHIFSDLHVAFAWVLSIMLVVHIGAAIKHHYWDKDDTLRRMI